MVMLDVLSNALISIKNVEAKGGKQVVIWPSSKLVGNVLRVMQRYGYIGEFEYVYDGRGGKYIVQLLGRINDIGPIKPRFHVKVGELQKWEEKYLPARQIGILILSTSRGVMSHLEARESRTGGVLLAYVY
ncbi:MAG: 30S ribosomal protein S8 [Caldivirga sp.]|jgi:small subunit ribosomal protein S8